VIRLRQSLQQDGRTPSVFTPLFAFDGQDVRLCAATSRRHKMHEAELFSSRKYPA
jgi:hypothetical protein